VDEGRSPRPVVLLPGALLLLVVGCTFTPAPESSPVPIESQTKVLASIAPTEEPTHFLSRRLEMVQVDITGAGIHDSDVLRAMRNVPRHKFVPAEYIDQAYENHPLPIGFGQTISQPFIVAWMTDLLDLQPGDRVLEIGTGSGYQAAILAELGPIEVFTMEIVPQLSDLAANRMNALGYTEVQVRQGDGYYGWAEAAPFDAIIVTAAPDHIPAPLVEQLSEGGRLVIPIGPAGFYQSLWQFTKEDGELLARNMGGVSFVPFTGPGIDSAPGEIPP
jgi:protein-L-isoaspartate(D-aspartate) O-methyltransferase